jgi:hypothetical protein
MLLRTKHQQATGEGFSADNSDCTPSTNQTNPRPDVGALQARHEMQERQIHTCAALRSAYSVHTSRITIAAIGRRIASPKSVIGVRSNVIGWTAHDQVKRYMCNRSAIFHPLSPGREGIFVEHQQRKFLRLPLVESTAVRRSRFTVALSTGQSSLPWMLSSFVQGSGLTGWSLASKEIHAGPGSCVLFFEQLDGLFKGPSASSFV